MPLPMIRKSPCRPLSVTGATAGFTAAPPSGQRQGQRLLQVGDQVAGVLDAHAQAQQVRRRWRAHAFDAGPVEELHAKRAELIAKGIKVTAIVDHEWVLSIYFKDPNGLLLEYAVQTRAPADPHVSPGRRIMASMRGPSRVTDFRDS